MKPILSILNLEDDKNDFDLNKEMLESEGIECQMIRVETRSEFLRVIQQGNHHDLILADYSMPSFDGLSALDMAHQYCPDIPFIFVSGTLGEEIAIETLKRGATDYIIKDKLYRLAPAVRRALKEKEARDDRRRAEQALRESEERYRNILESMEEGYYEVDLSGNLTFFNQAAYRNFGATRREIKGLNAGKYIHPKDMERIGSVYDQVFRTGIPARLIEYRLIDNKGVVREIEASASLIKDSSGNPIGFRGILRDRTDLKKVEQALRRSEERQFKLIQQLFDIIFETDEYGVIKIISPQSEQVFGYKPEEMVGKHFHEFLIESEREGMIREFRRSLNGEEVGTLGLIARKKDGSDIHCELRSIVERDGDEVLGTFGVIRDLTEWRKMQAHLLQSQRMEAIGTLAGGIAHDFNNILGGIVGYTQLALFDLPPGSTLKIKLDEVLKASDRARDLVRQILAFSRQSENEQAPMNVLPVLKEAFKLLRASLPTNIKMTKKMGIKEDFILGNPTHIHQLVMNLCTNAAQAIGGGEGLIEINLEEVILETEDITFPTLTPGPFLKLSFRDTGQGIDPAILPRIFDPFFTTKQPGEGTGMGLSVVHGIVKDHRGEIKVYSEPGKGTTFSIYLPKIKVALSGEGKTRNVIPRGEERILFVDDEPSIVESWVEMLGRLGYKVSGRVSPIEALEAFRISPRQFDLVITDQTMPHMSGFALARAMLAIRPDLPIILCSGFSEEITPEKAEAMGIKRYLMKPILLGELAEGIRKVLDGYND